MINIKSINNIVNKKFNTDKGWLYLVDLIKERYPYFNINEENLASLKIVPLSQEEFRETGFVGEYVASKNEIRILEEITDYDITLTEEEILETFLHELIHALTSKILKEQDLILEGFNQRRISDKLSSFFLALSEGVTQFITNDLLERKSDAYPFEAQIAYQLSMITSKENLISWYSNNDVESLLNELNRIDINFDVRKFIIDLYAMHLVLKGVVANDDERRATNIENSMLDMYLQTEGVQDKEFFDSLITAEMAEDIINPQELQQYGVIQNINDFGFKDIDEVKLKASEVLDWRGR